MSRTTKNLAISLIIVGLVILFIGVGIGIFYQIYRQANDVKIQQTIKMEPTVNILTSKLVQSIMIYGTVKNINGNSLDLSYNGDEITLNIGSSAQVFSSLPKKDPKTGNLITGIPQQVGFNDIKVGETVTVASSILGNGQLEGNSVYIILPAQ